MLLLWSTLADDDHHKPTCGARTCLRPQDYLLLVESDGWENGALLCAEHVAYVREMAAADRLLDDDWRPMRVVRCSSNC